MKGFILGWTDKAEALVTGDIVWSSGSQLQEQIRAYQVSLYRESQQGLRTPGKQSFRTFVFQMIASGSSLCSQALLRECRGVHGDLEAMGEREAQLGKVLQTEGWNVQVKHLSRRTEELQQAAKTRLQSLQDAAKVNDVHTRQLSR